MRAMKILGRDFSRIVRVNSERFSRRGSRLLLALKSARAIRGYHLGSVTKHETASARRRSVLYLAVVRAP